MPETERRGLRISAIGQAKFQAASVAMNALVSARSLVPRRDWALFLDVDGTLFPIRDTPEAVVGDDGVTRLLAAIAPCLGNALALISGRPIEFLDGLFAPWKLPAAGQHGLERRDVTGNRSFLPVPASLEKIRSPLRELERSVPGLIVEDKSHALAVHFRQVPGRGPELMRNIETIVENRASDLQVLPGKMVAEIKPLGTDKGAAINTFMKERPFRDRVPVFVGDDTTDESGFACVNAMNGHSIRVGNDGEATRARYEFLNVDEVLDWLETLPSQLQPSHRSIRREQS